MSLWHPKESPCETPISCSRYQNGHNRPFSQIPGYARFYVLLATFSNLGKSRINRRMGRGTMASSFTFMGEYPTFRVISATFRVPPDLEIGPECPTNRSFAVFVGDNAPCRLADPSIPSENRDPQRSICGWIHVGRRFLKSPLKQEETTLNVAQKRR